MTRLFALAASSAIALASLGACESAPHPTREPAEAIDLARAIAPRAFDARQTAPAIDLTLAERADEPSRIALRARQTSIGFRMLDTVSVVATRQRGAQVFANAWKGSTLVRAVLDDGIEDFVIVDAPPKKGSMAEGTSMAPDLRYEIDVREAAGLRLAENVLELLDEAGAPRLRVTAPAAFTNARARIALTLDVEGCSVDRSPAPPWGRTLVRPNAETCIVHVSWIAPPASAYPIVVDPAFRTTKNLAQKRDGADVHVLTTAKVIVLGGFDGTASCSGLSTELFDPTTETWATLAATPRCGGFVALPANKLLAVDGGGASILDVALGTWSPTNAVATGGTETAALLTNGKVVGVGRTDSQIWDPGTNGWTALNARTLERRDLAVAPLPDARTIILGGWNFNDTTLRSTMTLEAGGLQWTLGAETQTGAHPGHFTRLLDGRILVAGGSGTLQTAEIYDPKTASFSPAGKLNEPRHKHALVTLDDGRVLAAGGGIYPPVSSTEVYDPKLVKWLAAGPMLLRRTYFAMAPLPGGRALIPGGFGGTETGSIDFLAESEVFDPIAVGNACGADGECKTGYCVDGVCCDKSCKIPCHACSAKLKGKGKDGTCEPVVAGLEPNGRCAPTEPSSCGPVNGSCTAVGTCIMHPKGIPCGTPGCSDAVVSIGACGGDGSCAIATTSCSPFACGDGATCRDKCFVDKDCAKGFGCELATARCVPRPAQCDENVLVSAEGARTDCAPFRCVDGACSTRCRSALECTNGALCNRDGACVPANTAVLANDDGCRAAPAGSFRTSSRTSVLLSAAVALLVVRLLRRKGRSS